MEERKTAKYISLLESELIPALGCTEPIAVAFAAAKAAEVLGEEPERLVAECSGNIVKNVMGVTVPNSGNQKGIAVAATLGAVAGNSSDGLQVLESVTERDISYCQKKVDDGYCQCLLAEGVDNLYIRIKAYSAEHITEVTVAGSHTNIVKIVKDGNALLEKEQTSAKDGLFSDEITLTEIIRFAETVQINEIEKTLENQINCNVAISQEGLKNSYGANIGKTLIKRGHADFASRVKGKVAAGSDARMNGCNMPVVINSGSGNQGLAVCLPVVEYAQERQMPRERLIRALAVSNLVSIYVKKKIGSLSAFCGAATAAAASGAGIAFLKGWKTESIEEVIESTLLNVGGIFCDGAKSTCAAKLATALDAMLMSVHMLEDGQHFGQEEGLRGIDVEETVSNVCYVGRNGMGETDRNILRIMTGEIVTAPKER